MADLADDIDVPAGFDFDLDALVAGVEFGLDFIEKLRDGILNSDGDAAGDLGAGASADVLCERDVWRGGLLDPRRRLRVRRAP